MANTLAQSLTVELAQLDLLLATYGDLLVQVQQQVPGTVELAALATILHSYYNGAESMFLAVARQSDHQVPDESRWHQSNCSRCPEHQDFDAKTQSLQQNFCVFAPLRQPVVLGRSDNPFTLIVNGYGIRNY